MNTQQIETFLKLQPQLKSAYEEISLLSKKKPTDQLNKFKLKFINSILSRANGILAKKYQPFPDEFELFDEDDMPNNGDVVFILSHYLTSLEKLRCDNIERESEYPHYWYWKTNNKLSDKRTDPPTIK
ncbi:MAG TPA: hypothetical protein PKA32_00180 [Candidatus Gracilibacteria bacterium]|nr:hypothetical protein [Candidatus Gracilibacteria bacterium]